MDLTRSQVLLIHPYGHSLTFWSSVKSVDRLPVHLYFFWVGPFTLNRFGQVAHTIMPFYLNLKTFWWARALRTIATVNSVHWSPDRMKRSSSIGFETRRTYNSLCLNLKECFYSGFTHNTKKQIPLEAYVAQFLRMTDKRALCPLAPLEIFEYLIYKGLLFPPSIMIKIHLFWGNVNQNTWVYEENWQISLLAMWYY